MKKFLATLVLIGWISLMWAAQPYYSIGESNKSVGVLMAEVTKLLLKSDFEVLGIYHPTDDKNLGLIVFTCDKLTSMATSVADKGAFGATLRIGFISKGETTDVTLLNPHYVNQAYFGKGANKDEALKMTCLTDSLVKNAIAPLLLKANYYGRDIPSAELKNYQYLPTMPRYNDVVELNVFNEYVDAVASVKANLLKGVSNSQLVYELAFDDKEISVFGVAFEGNNSPDKQMLDLMGVHCIPSMPFEILVQGQKVYMLSPSYRIPLFNADLSVNKFFKVMSIAADLKSRMESIAVNE